jgi:hypothetical protein
METPVAFIIFNRARTTERVFEQIALARPRTLLVIADGPRVGRAGEAEKCAATRAIVERVDWDCRVLKNYSDENLGVGIRPASGLRWVFEQVEEAIILEDDCVPHPTFFRYCEELLERYRDDQRVMHISGDNWGFTPDPRPFSYFFSRYCYSCGWATWRRAFRLYDPEIRLWPTLRDTSWMMDLLGDPEAVEFWTDKFDRVHRTGIANNGWDWPWLFACWTHHALSILPRVNLIHNIGFGEEATHTKQANGRAVPGVEMTFPLEHPPLMARDVAADRVIIERVGLRRQPQDLYHRLGRSCLAALPVPMRRSIQSARSILGR